MQYKDFVKWSRWPTTWCGGCAIGIVFKQVIFSLERMGLAQNELTVVSGIGCSGRAAGYFNVDSVHVTHGRALPVAEGIKRGNPHLKVLVFSGDGDLVGIGGNHLIHTARRNVDLTVICINNQTYGMTGGQMAPTTLKGTKTLTSPHGNRYHPLNIQGLITSNHNYFYARSSAYHINHLQKVIREAFAWPGFAFIEVVAYCIENFGRRLGYRFGYEMLLKIKGIYKINRSPKERLKENELGVLIK
ncbi:MAG: 2-oxoacid:ferredoxin oxidoreductase subunit beta [Candidatus Aminicenantes bacterium]|nr:MAG: 2-oxoacid:ferredoxin oxidoreductase subunit beta [Candidatus Aminicenantes bacterium]HDJ23244.1 2-oxoacid:ferredoxin oxidoreductase subunit beta [Candidatus Aminicenantes bacterium]